MSTHAGRARHGRSREQPRGSRDRPDAPERVASAAEAKRLLAGEREEEALAGDIQRVIVLAAPVVRMMRRGAGLSRPWVMAASSAVAVGVTVHSGVRELQLLAALVAHRIRADDRRTYGCKARQEGRDRSVPGAEAHARTERRQAAPGSADAQMVVPLTASAPCVTPGGRQNAQPHPRLEGLPTPGGAF